MAPLAVSLGQRPRLGRDMRWLPTKPSMIPAGVSRSKSKKISFTNTSRSRHASNRSNALHLRIFNGIISTSGIHLPVRRNGTAQKSKQSKALRRSTLLDFSFLARLVRVLCDQKAFLLWGLRTRCRCSLGRESHHVCLGMAPVVCSGISKV